METIRMTSCVRQVANNAFLGFDINIFHLDNNGRGRGHKTMPKGWWKQTTRNSFTEDRDNWHLTTSHGLKHFFSRASFNKCNRNTTQFFTNIKYKGEGQEGKNTLSSVCVLLPNCLGPCQLDLTGRGRISDQVAEAKMYHLWVPWFEGLLWVRSLKKVL